MILYVLIVLVLAIFAVVLALKIRQQFFSSNDNAGMPAKTASDSVADPNALSALKNIASFGFPKMKVENTQFTPKLPDYTISLGEISNLDKFPEKFSDQQKSKLTGDNFFIAKNDDKFYYNDPLQQVTGSGGSRVDDMSDLYVKIGGFFFPEDRKPQNAVFVSSDWTLHTFHKLLEKELEYIEQGTFYQDLRFISSSMLDVSLKQYASAQDDQKKESYQRISTFFLVPTVLLDTAWKASQGSESEFGHSSVVVDNDSDSIEKVMAQLDTYKSKVPRQTYETAKAELEYIMGAKDVIGSPLFYDLKKENGLDEKEDYTQYSPRSHYNKNPVLRSYFRAMMWYGRSSFPIKSEKLTRDAANIALLAKSNDDVMQKWQRMYAVTTFIVGASDDLTIDQYATAINALQKDENKPWDSLIGDLQSVLDKYEGPKIMSSAFFGDKVMQLSKEELQNKTKGFRFMGQRFVPDAFVFSTITQGDEKPDEKTGESLPSSTTAMAVMSILGSQKADGLFNEWMDKNAPGSKHVMADRMDSLKTYFSSLSQDEWTQNIYWSWLYTLKPLLASFSDGYPMFCRNESWDRKDLQSALGSWTELKHDTLLYAKQSYAEMGGGGPEGEIPAVPKGYVEPNIAFFDRLIGLVSQSKDGLDGYKLLDNTLLDRNDKLANELEFLRGIAVKEVQNEKISDEDFEKLRTVGYRMSSVIEKLPDETVYEKDARSALIADVHTDVPNRQIVYEATGIPNYVYVAVKDINGVRLTKGAVYNYYEFTKPLEKRINDETWQQWNYEKGAENIPSKADWNGNLVNGNVISGNDYDIEK